MSVSRPLPWTAGTLILGTLSGLGAVSGLLVGAVGAVAVGALAVPRARGPSRPVLLAGALLVALGFLRARLVEPRPPEPAHGSELARARDEPAIGRWRPVGARAAGRGWLDPDSLPVRPGHRLLFELEVPAPRAGAWVAVLPGGDVTPWPRGPVPGQRSRGSWLGSSRVHADELVRLDDGPQLGFAPSSWAARLRRELGERTAALERPGPSAGLVRALIVGDRSALPAGRVDLFTRTGTRHLLALSGLHVGLFFACFLLPLTRLVAHERLRFGIQVLMLGAYTVSVGAGDPVTRASLALALGHLAPFLPGRGRRPELGRRADTLSIWSFALLLECLIAPSGLLSLSLQLSYAATLGLLLGTRRLSAMLLPAAWRSGPEAGIHSVGWTCGRIARRWLAEPLVRGVAASAAAVFATLPISWSAFGEWSPVGLLVTPLSMPLLAGLIATSWLGVFVPALGAPGVLESLAALLIALLEAADGLPGTPTPLPPRPTALLFGLVALGFVALEVRRLRRPVLAGWALVLFPWSLAPAGLELHALDVGHGSAIALRAPGLPALVFDAGSRDRRGLYQEALAPLLRTWDVARVTFALSHAHMDHQSGLPRLIERFPPALYLGARPAHVAERLPHDTLRLDAGPGRTHLATAAPEVPLELAWLRGDNRTGNEGSRSLEVRWRGERLLLCGDAEEDGLAAILALEPDSRPLRLLLFPHHGSDTPLSGRLLRSPPEEIWISVSRRPAVAAELERRGLRWRWTGRDGPLALYLR